jgi:KDO2-lipid IV(A) lauroyltransferase
LRNSAEAALVKTALARLRATSREDSPRLARRFLAMVDKLSPKWRKVAFRNLDLAMPHLDAEDRERVVDGCYWSLARMLASLARFPEITRETVSDWIRYEGFEHFEEAKRRGKGVLFATGHLGNWELSAYAHALMAEPMSIVIRPLDNPMLDAMSEEYRGLSGNRILGRKDFLRPVLKALTNNEAVGILVDQNTTADRGVFVDFFGVKACVDSGFAKLAAHSGATVIPGFALWSDREAKYVLKFYEPVAITGEAQADTQAIQRALEAAIRQHPDQWLWIHRRWKTRPPGEPNLYS